MPRRSLPVLATVLAFVLLLVAAVPAFAYNNENPYHLRLSRLDPLQCGTRIGIQAKLTDRDGHPVSGAAIHFTIDEGRRGDKLAPARVVTNARGKAVTFVILACTNGTHFTEILARGPRGAKARITLILHNHHDRNRGRAAAVLSVGAGSTGSGTGQAAPATGRSVLASPVVFTSQSSALAPVGLALLGLLIVLLVAFGRHQSTPVRRLATA